MPVTGNKQTSDPIVCLSVEMRDLFVSWLLFIPSNYANTIQTPRPKPQCYEIVVVFVCCQCLEKRGGLLLITQKTSFVGVN